MTTPTPPTRRHPVLCVACGVHLGGWPEDDPRCPACRYSGQEAS